MPMAGDFQTLAHQTITKLQCNLQNGQCLMVKLGNILEPLTLGYIYFLKNNSEYWVKKLSCKYYKKLHAVKYIFM